MSVSLPIRYQKPLKYGTPWSFIRTRWTPLLVAYWKLINFFPVMARMIFSKRTMSRRVVSSVFSKIGMLVILSYRWTGKLDNFKCRRSFWIFSDEVWKEPPISLIWNYQSHYYCYAINHSLPVFIRSLTGCEVIRLKAISPMQDFSIYSTKIWRVYSSGIKCRKGIDIHVKFRKQY